MITYQRKKNEKKRLKTQVTTKIKNYVINLKNNQKSRKLVVQPSLKSSIIMQYVLFQNVHDIHEMTTR